MHTIIDKIVSLFLDFFPKNKTDMNPIISKNIRVRHPELFKVGNFSIVDDYSYFSTGVIVGECSHIAAGCNVGGGSEFTFRLGDFCSLSSGVKIWCVSNDFVNDLVTIIPPNCPPISVNPLCGNVTFENYTAAGSNSIIMPDNVIPEGTVIGALTYIPYRFKMKPWSVYAGSPARLVKDRNKDRILAQIKQLREFIRSQ